MASELTPKCHVCDKPAASKCGGCKSTARPHSYCSRDCQRKDWPKHKNICNDLSMHSHLARVAVILRDTYLMFRENTWDMPVRSIEVLEDKLIIHRDYDNDKDYFVKFPKHLVREGEDDVEHQVLSTWMCEESLAWMHDLSALLLSRLAVDVEEVNVALETVPRPTVVKHTDGLERPNWPRNSHDVLRITSRKTKSQWVIDLTNAQYGIRQFYWSWPKFVDTYVQCVIGIYPFGTNKELKHRLSKIRGNTNLDYGLVGEVSAHMNTAVKQWTLENDIRADNVVLIPHDLSAAAAADMIDTAEQAIRKFIDGNNFTSRLRSERGYEAKHQSFLQMERGHIINEFLDNRNLVKDGPMFKSEAAYQKKMQEIHEGGDVLYYKV